MRKNNNIKFFIFILLFLSLGIIYAPSAFAAFGGGGSNGGQFDGGGQIVQEEANLGWNIKSVAKCWSISEYWTYPATADEKKKLDAPVGAFAHLTFDNSGVFNAEASSSENVTEHGG